MNLHFPLPSPTTREQESKFGTQIIPGGVRFRLWAPDARAVMLLRYQEDLDPSDIARALGMSVNTVKSHVRRSLDWLRAQYTGEDHGY